MTVCVVGTVCCDAPETVEVMTTILGDALPSEADDPGAVWMLVMITFEGADEDGTEAKET